MNEERDTVHWQQITIDELHLERAKRFYSTKQKTNMNLSKFFGPSWKTTLGGIITFIGGLGALIAQAGLTDTKTGQIVTGISASVALFGVSFGLSSAKDASVTGIGDKATTDTSKDATK